MPSTDEIRTLIDRYLELFSSGPRDAWLELWAPDATMDDPLGDVKTGREAIGAFYDLAQSMADSIELRIAGPVKIVGNEAAFVATIEHAIGGSRMSVDVIETWVVNDDGQLQAMRAYWSLTDLAPAS